MISFSRGTFLAFQSTLPARGATPINADTNSFVKISIHAPRTGSDVSQATYSCYERDFNPRSPHGERRFRALQGLAAFDISIHAPRTGSDLEPISKHKKHLISIHAPRTGSDNFCKSACLSASDFNPRSPHGERLPREICEPVPVPISIHAPRTGSDRYHFFRRLSNVISIHAPRTGSDAATHSDRRSQSDFNPRSPHGERRG